MRRIIGLLATAAVVALLFGSAALAQVTGYPTPTPSPTEGQTIYPSPPPSESEPPPSESEPPPTVPPTVPPAPPESDPPPTEPPFVPPNDPPNDPPSLAATGLRLATGAGLAAAFMAAGMLALGAARRQRHS